MAAARSKAREDFVPVECLGNLPRMGLGEERRVPDLEGQPNHGPSFGHNIFKDMRCQLPHGVVHLGRLGQVALERRLPAMPAGNPRGVVHNAGAVPASEFRVPRTHPGAELRDQVLGVGRGELGDCVDAELGQPAGHFGSDAPQVFGGPTAHDVEPVPGSQTEDAGRLAEAGGDLGPNQCVADAHAAMQLRSLQDSGLHLPGVGFRILGLSAYKGFIPTQHLDGGAGLRAQGSHHNF
jgi:hypothetical protein